MSDLLPQILLPLTAGSFGLLMLLTAALVAERVLRNRRELAARTRRMAYAEMIATNDVETLAQLASLVSQSYVARGDLVDALAMAKWPKAAVFPGHAELLQAAMGDAEHRDVARRAVGAALLGVVGTELAVEVLQLMMREDPDRELRLVAARGLRVVGGEQASWALIRGLRDSVIPVDRILEQLGRPFAAHELLHAMQIADFNAVRADIADALGLAGYAPAAHALGGLVRFGNERERIKACRALGRLGNPEVVPLLGRAMKDEVWIVRAQSATALGLCGVPAAVGPLAAALGDENWWVRANCATALRQCGAAGRNALRFAAQHHPDRYARDRALESLALDAAARGESDAPGPALEERPVALTLVGREHVHAEPRRTPVHLGNANVVPLFARALKDDVWIARAQTATAVGAYVVQAAVAPLATALGDRGSWVRANGPEALRQFGLVGRNTLRAAVQYHADREVRARPGQVLAFERPGRIEALAA
jgi:HEAT repeat protein